MTVRVRVAIALAASLIVAVFATLLIGLIALRNTDYQTWDSYRTALLTEFGISSSKAAEQLSEHPEYFFDARGSDNRGHTGRTLNEAAQAVQRHAVQRAVSQSRRWVFLALGAVTLGTFAVGWLLAGRILRPVRLMTSRARAASELELTERVSLDGPNDEMKELADTFDTMLDRLAYSFDAQRRFSAQAAHELRTPLTLTRSEVEMLLVDVDDPGLRARLESIADATDRAERLVARLLVLSRTDSRDLDLSVFALDDLVGNVVGRAVEHPAWHGVRVNLELRPSPVVGDRALIETLVRNLVENACRHNGGEGWVTVGVQPGAGRCAAELLVANSTNRDGPIAQGSPPWEPHIGLTIVAAVLDAHRATLTWHHQHDEVSACVGFPTAGALVPAGAATAT